MSPCIKMTYCRMPATSQPVTIDSTNVIFILSFQVSTASGLDRTEVWQQLDRVNLIDSKMNPLQPTACWLLTFKHVINSAVNSYDHIASVADVWRRTENECNDTDREEQQYSYTKLSQSHFFHHKTHVNWHWNCTQQSKVTDQQLMSQATAQQVFYNLTVYMGCCTILMQHNTQFVIYKMWH